MRGGSEVATDYHYTGQRWQAALGLYYYNARWYDPAMRRFVQADSIVPEPGNPQTLNRYAYANNSPVRYNNPSGHIMESEETAAQAILDDLALYGAAVEQDWGWYEYAEWTGTEWTDARVWIEGEWELTHLETVRRGVARTASELFGGGVASGQQRFADEMGDLVFVRADIQIYQRLGIYQRVSGDRRLISGDVYLYSEAFAPAAAGLALLVDVIPDASLQREAVWR